MLQLSNKEKEAITWHSVIARKSLLPDITEGAQHRKFRVPSTYASCDVIRSTLLNLSVIAENKVGRSMKESSCESILHRG